MLDLLLLSPIFLNLSSVFLLSLSLSLLTACWRTFLTSFPIYQFSAQLCLIFCCTHLMILLLMSRYFVWFFYRSAWCFLIISTSFVILLVSMFVV